MNKQFWDFLLNTALEIDDLDPISGSSARALALIETIDVVYKGAFDPADAYEAYVAVTLCSALRKKLARSQPVRDENRRTSRADSI